MTPEPERTDDASLLEAWRAGSASAGETLLSRHFDVLYRFFRSKVDGPIDDLIQGTMLGAVEAKERFRGDATFKTFVLGIARNQLLRSIRARQRASKVFEPEQDSMVASAMDTSATERLGRHDERRLLISALRRLPLDLQIVVELFYWEGLSVSETASVCDVPTGTIKSRLSRARQRLHQTMKDVGVAHRGGETLRAELEAWASDVRAALAPRGL